MNQVTSITNPALFGTAPVLPTGYYYRLLQVGVYEFGNFQQVYRIDVIRSSDDLTIEGNPFYPYDGYPSGAQMVIDEATNTYNTWNNYYLADGIATQAVTAIGF